MGSWQAIEESRPPKHAAVPALSESASRNMLLQLQLSMHESKCFVFFTQEAVSRRDLRSGQEGCK